MNVAEEITVNIYNLSTPYLAVDKEIFEENIKQADLLFKNRGKHLRPHFKTHRTPELLLRQMTDVTIGATCSTIGEAETAMAAGISDILIANTFASADKIKRIGELSEKCLLTVSIDCAEHLKMLSDTGAEIRIMIEVDTGLHRCGISDPEVICRLADLVSKTPKLHFAGITGYEGRFRKSLENRADKIKSAYSILSDAKRAIELYGIRVENVSAAGTSTLYEALNEPVITEIQAGTYSLMEPDIMDLGLPFKPAVYVTGTVISTASGFVILDAGRRSVSYEYGLPVCLDPSGKVIKLNDEHAILEWNGQLPQIGSKIALRPTQNRTTFNLHDTVWLVDRNNLAEKLNITARGLSN